MDKPTTVATTLVDHELRLKLLEQTVGDSGHYELWKHARKMINAFDQQGGRLTYEVSDAIHKLRETLDVVEEMTGWGQP